MSNQEEKEQSLEKPNPSPISNRLFEQSKYLYHIATQLNVIITLLKNQYGEQVDRDPTSYLQEEENSVG